MTILFKEAETNSGKKSKEAVLKGWLQKSAARAEKVHHTATFTISSDFGQPGAIIVTNQHQKEFFFFFGEYCS
jgi:lipoxygenase